MPLSDDVVVVVMGRCNLHSSGAERHVNLLIRHNRHAAIQKRMQRKFSLPREKHSPIKNCEKNDRKAEKNNWRTTKFL